MTGQLEPIADKVYEHSDGLHTAARMLLDQIRHASRSPIIPDWYPLLGALVAVTGNLGGIVGQIPSPYAVYDLTQYYDDRGDNHDPAYVAGYATGELQLARTHSGHLRDSLNRAWSALGHLGYREGLHQ